MVTSASAPILRLFQTKFWAVEDVITRRRTASGHVDVANGRCAISIDFEIVAGPRPFDAQIL
jgi:hypothetical protein